MHHLLGLLLAESKPVDVEGREIITGMLIVGLIFLGVIVLGEVTKYLAHHRKTRR